MKVLPKTPSFVVISTYTEPFDAFRDLLPAHHAFADRAFAQGNFAVCGQTGARTGSVFIASGLSREALDAVMREDPFYIHGKLKFEIIEFNASRACDGLGSWFDGLADAQR